MKPRIIVAFVILIFSAVLAFALVMPKFEETTGLRVKHASQTEETSDVKAKFDTTRLAILQFQKLREPDKDRVNLALPDEVDLPDLLVLVDALISRAGLIGEDININVPSSKAAQVQAPVLPAQGAIAPKFLAPQEPPGRGEIDISFSAVGSYESFKSFLKELEMSLRIFDVQTVSFDVPQLAEKISGAFRFGVSMKTYYNNQ